MADFPPNIAKATATAVNKLTIPPKSSAAVAQQEPQIARNTRSESDRPKSDRAETARFKRARDALRDAGVFEPTASSLAKMPHVTADYVTAHALRARGEGATTGLLIHRMRCGDPSPELNARGHLAGCKCDECQRDRYRLYMPEDGGDALTPNPSPVGRRDALTPNPSPVGRGARGAAKELQYA